MATIKSIEEKAKAYDEALKVLHKYDGANIMFSQDLKEEMFPELKESEDERMIQYFKDLAPFDKADELYEKYGFSHKDAIAWLEKQGEPTEINPSEFDLRLNKLLKQFETLPKEELASSLSFYLNVVQNDGTYKEEKQGEQKPADKAEPKFHKGDWVVYCNDDVDLITGIEENGYCINNGGYIPFVCENEMRLWDITDAKVGDVLVSESTCGLGTWYCIFKSLDGDESMTVYCYLARDGRFETKKELCFDKDPYNTKPATKEQHDQLEKAMANAGYTFDFDKKELKKIEGNTAWSEEDEEIHRKCICAMRASACGFPEEEKFVEQVDNWLKSLRPQNTWKPTEQQMKVLNEVINFAADHGTMRWNDYIYNVLKGLREQLKKL